MNQFKVLGMHCGACQKVIEKRLSKINGVSTVTAELSGEVTVIANRVVDIDEATLALKGTDYTVTK